MRQHLAQLAKQVRTPPPESPSVHCVRRATSIRTATPPLHAMGRVLSARPVTMLLQHLSNAPHAQLDKLIQMVTRLHPVKLAQPVPTPRRPQAAVLHALLEQSTWIPTRPLRAHAVPKDLIPAQVLQSALSAQREKWISTIIQPRHA